MTVTIHIEDNKAAVIAKLASKIQEIAAQSIAANGVFKIGLSGGSLVNFLKEGLPKVQTDFAKWRLFFCDERVVPEDSPDSTYGLYKALVDSSFGLEKAQFIKIKQGVSAHAAAEDYIHQMAPHFTPGSIPRFDLLLLGMGPDGHTCSLFPGHQLLEESSKWVAPITDSPKPPPSRITLTFPVINNASNCIFALCGKEKADMIKRILVDKEDLPATRIKPLEGNLIWIMDKEAGQHLSD